MRHIERIDGDMEDLALVNVHLRIDQRPALLGVVPIFRDPVVVVLARLKMSLEADGLWSRLDVHWK